MTGYRLAVDYGTSFTAAATVDGAAPEVLEFSSARHSRYLPSLVLVDQRGELHVGTRAVAKRGAVPPDHVCVAPKRQLGPESLTLGSMSLSAADVVAATLAKVADEARHQHNGQPPDEVVMTHPALWSPPRCEVLRAAAVKAGLADDPATVLLVPEPVAAVTFYAAAGAGPTVAVGESVAVYDLGGGTFDCAVLSRAATGWTPAGPPGGDERLGGEDFDEALLEWVADRLMAEDPAAWAAFEGDDSPRGRSDWVSMLELIRSAKEDLSSEETTEVGLPPGQLPLDSLLINRAEFTALIGEALDRSMRAFAGCLERAGVAPAHLSAVYLTGGSSRIPAVKGELHRRFGIEPTTYKDPKSITALGALLYEERPVTEPAARRSSIAISSSGGGARRFILESCWDFTFALSVAADFAGDSGQPMFDNVMLALDKDPVVVGGNESRVAIVDIAGHGDECEVYFPAKDVLTWLGKQESDGPIQVIVGPGEIRFERERDGVGVPILVSDDFGYALPDLDAPEVATVDFDFAAASPMFQMMRKRSEARLPLVLNSRSVVIGGYPLSAKADVVAEVSASLPRVPLLEVLEYICRIGSLGEIEVIATSTDCSIRFAESDKQILANFRMEPTATSQPARQPPATNIGTAAASAMVRITPKGAYGGFGARNVTFKVKVDGTEIPTRKKAFEPVDLELSPGTHTIETWCRDAFMNTAKAKMVVQLVSGQRLNLLYQQPPTTLQAGRLTIS